MRLSNKSTFSLICIIALFVLVASMPAMAQVTIEATWSEDRNDDNTSNDPGWRVTVAGLANSDNVDVTYLDPAGTAAAALGTQAGFADAAADGTSTTGQIEAAIGAVIAVQVAAGASGSEVTYQRVTFPAGGPGATLASTTLVRLPKLAKLTVSEYYASFGETVTITFNFAAAVADTNGAPMAPLHVSDLTNTDGTTTFNGTGWAVESVKGTNEVTLRAILNREAPSADVTATLRNTYAQPTGTSGGTPPDTDGHVTITYDDRAPFVTDPAIAAPAGFPTPTDGVWNSTFILTFTVDDVAGTVADSEGSGLPDTNPVRIETDTTKLDVGPVGIGPDPDTPVATANYYLVRITPKSDRATTAGEDVVITIVATDKAGNEGSMATSVKLAASTPPDALYESASPASGNVMRGGTITVTFDKDPGTVMAGGAVVPGTGNTRTLTVGASQAAGALSITLTWGQSGRQVLSYTVVVPDPPPAAAVAFSSAAPASGNVMAGGTVTLTFAADPGTVTASVGAITGTGATRTLTIPAGQAAGEVTITVSWTKTGHQAGSTMLTYTITRPFVSSNPTSPANISDPIEIPANSYVVVVRANPDPVLVGLDFPMVDGADVMIREWSDMPDLEALFNRSSFGQGGALVLRKSADARDNQVNDADGNPTNNLATPGVGSVGISEIMWGLDLGLTNRDIQPRVQWIELHNVNSKPVRVLLYAQTARELVSNGLVGNTAAGDSIIGNLGGNVIDVVQNIRDEGNQSKGGWNVPGDNGNSVTGDDFTSMYRILPHNQPAYSASQNYTKRNGRDDGVWRAATTAYAGARTDQPASATTDVVAITNYKGTPGQRNDYTGVSLITPVGRQNVPANSVIINEVANLSNPDYEWIELRNVTGSEIDLKNYLISIVTAVGTDNVLYEFPTNSNAKIPANGVFLLVATDPRDDHAQPSEHPIAIGWNVDKNAEDQVRGLGANPPRYKVTGHLNIPDNGNFVLILRRPDSAHNNRSGANDRQGAAERGEKDLDKIVDIAGYHSNLTKNGYPNALSNTKMWPLQGHGRGPQFNRNQFSVNTVHYRANVGTADGLAGAGAVSNVNDHRAAFQDAGFTGIGYKRQAARTNANGGTPGYHGIERSTVASGAKLIISEIMLSQGGGRTNLPQWIEIYNPNDTAVQLDAGSGWRIVIEEERINLRTLNFKSKGSVKRVLPKQTILVVSAAARDLGSDYLPSSVVFPTTRVYNVYREQASTFGMTSRFDPFLSENSFNLKLIDGSGVVSDEMGNLDGNVRTSDTAKYEFSQDTMTKEGLRTSYIRIIDNGVARNALSIEESNVLPLGAKEVDDTVNLARHQIPMKYAWIRASQADLGVINIRHTWYGSEEDFGTPLLREGAVLPVQLSSFRPVLEDGKVVIRWATESELDNAGFNIYRSETRNGEYKQVNAELIDGHGTTGERNTYKWVDASAKPGVTYYYQIEDVSFAGERQMLTTSKLKGLISAKNKLTTKWGEIKQVQ